MRRLAALLKQGYNFLPSDFPKRVVIRQIVGDHIAAALSSQDYESVAFNEQDWDNLIVLDGCRYDTFKRHSPFEQEVKRVNSNASHTIEFVRKNFAGTHRDTVYLTSSPMVSRFGGEFAHIEHLWKDCWSEEDSTVRPEDVADRAIAAAQEYPHKRLVAHFMQPHFPFIGEKGKQLGGATFNWSDKREDGHIWEKVLAGRLDVEEVRAAYEENLQVALPHVERLAGELQGKTVITADHGNLFGKRVIPYLPHRIYGHPAYLKDAELTAVPWLEFESGERKDVWTAEETTDAAIASRDDEDVKQRLEALGYRT